MGLMKVAKDNERRREDFGGARSRIAPHANKSRLRLIAVKCPGGGAAKQWSVRCANSLAKLILYMFQNIDPLAHVDIDEFMDSGEDQGRRIQFTPVRREPKPRRFSQGGSAADERVEHGAAVRSIGFQKRFDELGRELARPRKRVGSHSSGNIETASGKRFPVQRGCSESTVEQHGREARHLEWITQSNTCVFRRRRANCSSLRRYKSIRIVAPIASICWVGRCSGRVHPEYQLIQRRIFCW